MRLTRQLVKRKNDPAFVANGCENPVFRFYKPNLVPAIYREHVEGWWGMPQMPPEDVAVWHAGAEWLRALEAGTGPRLFRTEECLDDVWWAAQAKSMVSRRATSRRMVLPLGKEIDLCVHALGPHAIPWLLELVDDKHLDLAMYPKVLVHRAVFRFRHLSDEEFAGMLRTFQALYPEVKRKVEKEHVIASYVSCHLSHWPGLRLCPPFFPDLIALQPPPSLSRPRQGKYMVLHACLGASFAKTSIEDAVNCWVDELCVTTDMSRPPLALETSPANEDAIFTALSRLHAMHPRSFNPVHADSPYAAGALMLTEHVCETGSVKLPEHALDTCELGFSFTYMKPALLNDACPEWEKEEVFYEVRITYQGQDHFLALSSYVGLGLRLRCTLLSLVTPGELKGQGVCVVVPDGLDQESTDNLMLTCVGWLRDLRLSDVKLVSEGRCQAMCLRSVAVAAGLQCPATWASFHDGRLVCQALGVVVHSEQRVHDSWGDKYRTCALKDRLVEKMRDYFLGHALVKATIENLATHRFQGTTVIVESIKQHLPAILETLERDAVAALDMSRSTLTFPNAPAVTIEVPLALYHEWLGFSFEAWTSQPWWDELHERLEACQGIVVGGGVFDCCPQSAMRTLQSKLGPSARACTRRNVLNVLHGACMSIQVEAGSQHMMMRDGTGGWPLSKME
jgi:hypothetical protein